MTGEELKQALASKEPVVTERFPGGVIEYDYVSAVTYRIVNGRLLVSAELMNAAANSIAIVDAKFIMLKKDWEKK